MRQLYKFLLLSVISRISSWIRRNSSHNTKLNNNKPSFFHKDKNKLIIRFICLIMPFIIVWPLYFLSSSANDLSKSNSADLEINPLAITACSGINFPNISPAFATGVGPTSVAMGDLDGDGKLDLAIANAGDNTVSVLRNTSTSGNASFATQLTFATGVAPRSIAIGDLDGDGKPDLAIVNVGDGTNPSTVSVLRNTSTSGSVNFATQLTFSVGVFPSSIAIGDLDGDGKLDLAIANTGDFINPSTVSVLRNTSTSGSINFATQLTFATGVAPSSVAIGDLDGDGKPDLAIANVEEGNGNGGGHPGTVSVLRNTSTSGSVNFATQLTFAIGVEPSSVAIGDLDGDGKPDLAVANNSDSTVSVLENTSTSGSVNFATQLTFSTGLGPQSVAIKDLDGDGKPDLATANFGFIFDPSSVSVLRNTSSIGNINFATKHNFAARAIPQSVAIGDLDGDGKPDLATANSADNTVSVLRNTSSIGNISYATQLSFSTGSVPQSVAIGDLDGDGKPDLAIANQGDSTVSVLRNTSTSGSVNFATQLSFSTGVGSFSVAMGDIDGDGKPDLAIANSGDDTVSVLRNTSTSGNVNFATQLTFSVGSSPQSVVIGDIDGDGKPDLAIANSSDNTVSVLRNTSTSVNINFATQLTFSVGSSPQSVVIGDLDGDGKLDLAIANSGDFTNPSTVSVLRNTSTSGNVNFATQLTFATGVAPSSVAIGDLDGDGKPDLAIANSFNNTTSVLRNTSTSGSINFATQLTFSSFGSFSVAIGDLDGDGKPDLATADSFNNTTSVLRNTSSSGNINFATALPFSTGIGPTSVAIGDLDGDGKPDLAISNFGGLMAPGTVSVLANTCMPSQASTTTTVSSSANPSVFGQTVTFTATVSSTTSGTPTGTVQFKDGSTNLGKGVPLVNGQAQLLISSLSVGSHSITAVYSGDTNFTTSTSAALTQVVNKANTSTSLTASPTQIVLGQMVTFTSTVSANSPGAGTPTGTVTFKDGTTTLGSPSLVNGQATLTAAITNVGTRTITATYSGDTNFNSSTSTSSIILFVSTLEHNTIYVADTLNNRIQRSTDQGISWKTIGNGAGVAAGQFNAPKGVTSNFADTIVFVADTANNRIQRSTDGGVTWAVIATGGTATNQVNQPASVAYDEISNKLYVADTANNRILLVTNPTSISPIFTIFAGASAGTAVGKVNQPNSIAIDLNGKVYVADTANNRIQVNSNSLNTGWTLLATAGPAIGQVNMPKGLHVDNSGRIWVADASNNRIQVNINGVWSVFMNSGTVVGTVNHSEGVVVNLSGTVFIADTGNNRIQKKPAAGGTATIVGQPGLNVGQFNQPSGIR